MHLLSLNTGRPQIRLRGGRHYTTAIDRTPVSHAVRLEAEGLVGDEVGDRKHHGGPDMAVCCYCSEHYPHWSARLLGGVSERRADEPESAAGLLRADVARELPIPSFGENFTTVGMLETQVCVGDRFRVGSAIVQITQPRQPCSTLAGKHNEPRLVRWVNETGYSGFYLRVIEPGEVRAGAAFQLLDRSWPELTVERVFRVRLNPEPSPADLEPLASLPPLSESWRRWAQARLEGRSDEED